MSRRPFAARRLRFEPLERRELLAVTVGTVSSHGDLTVEAYSAGDQVDISFDSSGADTFYIDSDGDPTDADAVARTGVTGRFTVLLYRGATLTFHTDAVHSLANDDQLKFPGNLVIVGSTVAKDVITFTDDAGGGKGGAQIGGDFLFTGQGGGDELTIEAPAAGNVTSVGRHVSIDTGNDTVAVDIRIDGLELTGSAPVPGRNFDLTTGDNATIELEDISLADGNVSIETAKVSRASSTYAATVAVENLDTGGGNLKVSTGPGADTIDLEQVDTDGGDLVLLSDGGARGGGVDEIRLETVDLDDGNLTIRSGGGDDVVDLVDAIMTTGDVFIALGIGNDDLAVGSAIGATVTADNLWIRGYNGADTITVTNVETTGRLGIRTHRHDDTVTIGGQMPGPAATVRADSMKINTGAGDDTVEFVPSIEVSGTFRARGGPGTNDRTVGEGTLRRRFTRRVRNFEDRNT